ncbi:MAG: AraC family transcriptional regulator [Bacteroidota bacterium]|nr:AraC family transcriptional regulator [Bacteroidota bacterium]
MIKRKDGFTGQSSIILPGSLIQEMIKDNILNQLYLTDVGFYPNAYSHNRERKEGAPERILIFCVAGKGWFQVNQERKEVSAGEFFILPPNQMHAYGADRDDPWSIYWVHFSGWQSEHFALPDNELLGIVELRENDSRITLFEEIIQILGIGLSTENLSYVHFCLGHLLAMFRYNRIYDRGIRSTPRDVCETAMVFMQSRVYHKLRLDEIARAVNLSPSHFSALFRRRTNRSPMEYFIYLKIQRACHLLDTTTLRIKEVSSSLGFEDPYYFSRLFCKVMLTSPSDYRKKHKG